MKILIIGGGNMGETYAHSFLKDHVTTAKDLMILERSAVKARILQEQKIARIFRDPKDCVSKSDLIIFAVKPQDSDAVFKKIKKLVDPQQVVLSIMAGVKMERIQESLGVSKIIRAMPNLPAQIGMGMTTFTSTEEITRVELVTVQNLLNTTGKAIYVSDEALLDAATAVSGSGPAFVYFFMDAMMEAAKDLGFTESQAELLVGQTFLGSSHLLARDELSCKDWIKKVSSKGGTTEAAIRKFEENGLEKRIKEGLFSAHLRARELGSK